MWTSMQSQSLNCPSCGAPMMFIYSNGGRYWWCKSCGYREEHADGVLVRLVWKGLL